MKKSCIVVGGGFKGMIAAYLLAREKVEVTLIEKAPFLGGIMYSREWNGLYVDNGVQLFDSIPQNLAEIVREVLDDQVTPIDFNYASVYKGVTTPGLAIPDLSRIDSDAQGKILLEMVKKLTLPEPTSPQSLFDCLDHRFGSTAANLLDETMRHIYSISGKEISAEAINQMLYKRLRFLPDDMAIELKKHPELDGRIAAMRRNIGKVDDFVSLYPKRRAMRGFCESMGKTLEKMGVTIQLNTHVEDFKIDANATCILSDGKSITANHVIWANDYHQLSNVWHKKDLAAHIHHVPMVVYYFAIDPKICNNYTYFHKFTPGDLVFRPSAAGLYSEQINEAGETYISVECGANSESAIWKDPDAHAQKVWDECVQMGLLKESPMSKSYVWHRVPVTHRLPKTSFFTERKQLDDAVVASNNVMVIPDPNAFVRREIMWAVEASVENILAA
jgi:protoporphyrinogen oxidase